MLFSLGYLLGVISILVLSVRNMSLYKRILIMKSEIKTAEHINGEFYYIVPENEYVELITRK